MYKRDFEEHLVEYRKSLVENEAAKSTRNQYLYNAREFIDKYTANDKPLTKADTLQFKEDLENSTYKPKTISNKITTVNRFLYFCDQPNKAVRNIVIQTENTVEFRLTHSEFTRLRNRAKKNELWDLYWTIQIIGRMGLRFREIKYITDKSVQQTSVPISNKGTTDKIPIPKDLRYELRQFVKEHNIKGQLVTVTNQWVNGQLKNLAGECKIKKDGISTHTFRHYFAVRFMEVNGGEGSLEKLRNLLRHKSIETTKGYLGATTADIAEDMDRM